MSTIDKKAVLVFLVSTFASTWTVELGLILAGARFHPMPEPWAVPFVAVVMFFPAVSAWLTVKWVTHEPLRPTLLVRFGAWQVYVAVALLLPAGFVAIYGLTYLLGLGTLDWQLDGLLAMIRQANPAQAQRMQEQVTAVGGTKVLALLVFVGSLTSAPFVNAVAGLGEELGWRGFLLPKLMPLGKPRAYGLVGLLWGLWHAPLVAVGFGYGDTSPVLAIVVFVALLSAFSVSLNELTLRYQSAILAGWVHGVFNSQAYGVLPQLFVGVPPLLGGKTGLVAVVVWGALGVAVLLWSRRRSPECTGA